MATLKWQEGSIESVLKEAESCEFTSILMKDWGHELISQELIQAAVRKYCNYILHVDPVVKPLPPRFVCDVVILAFNHGCTSLISDNAKLLSKINNCYLSDILITLDKYYLEEQLIIEFFYDCFDKISIITAICSGQHFKLLNVIIDNSTNQQLKDIASSVFSQNVNPYMAHLIVQKMKKLNDPNIKELLNNLADNPSKLKEFISFCNSQMKGELINFCFSHTEPIKEKRKLVVAAILATSENIDITKIEFQNLFLYNIPMLLSNLRILNRLFTAGLSLDTNLCQNAIKMVLQNGCSLKHLKIICVLINKGAEIECLTNVYSQKGGTPLHGATKLALETGNIEVFQLICRKLDRTCVHKSDTFKSTPLHIVMKHSRCDTVAIEICRILCEDLKINPRLKDHSGKTAAEYCLDQVNDPRMSILKSFLSVHDELSNAEEQLVHMKTKAESKKEKNHKTKKKGPTEKPKESSQMKGEKKQTAVEQKMDFSHNQSIKNNKTSTAEVNIFHEKEENLKHYLELVLKKDATYFAPNKLRDAPLDTNINNCENENENTVKDLKDIRPLSNVKDEDETDGERNYDVFYSPRVKKFLETGERSLVTRTLQTIDRLARGESNYVLVRKMYGKLGHSSIYHSNIDSAKRVIWHKKVTYSPCKRKNCKVLVILDVVLDHDKLDKAVDNAKNWIKQGREEGGTYQVKRIAKGYYEVFNKPLSLENNNDEVKDVPFMMKDEYGAVQIYSIPEYVLSRVMSMSEGELKRFGLPLKLSQEEHSIVDMNFEEESIVNLSYHKKTILVVGRSGTGKTTCCLQRLWEEFLHYWENVNETRDPIIPRLQNFETKQSSLEEPGIIPDIELKNSDDKSVEIHTVVGTCANPIKVSTLKDESFHYLPHSEKEISHSEKEIKIIHPEKEINLSPSEKEINLSPSEGEVIEEQSTIDDCDHLHQVFVTKSSYLCHEVKRRFYDLVSSHSSLWEQFHTFENFPLPSSLHDSEIPFPLFVTSRNLLMLLDGSLDESFFNRKNGKLLDKIQNSEQMYLDKVITDILENDQEEDDDSDSENEEENEENEFGFEQGTQQKITINRQLIEITASFFKNHIWNEIAHGNAAKEIDPILVWQEIKSFIKGSVQALKSSCGFLSKEEYKTVGKNKAPNFHNYRDKIYFLFEKYQKFCNSPTDKGIKYFDECDLLFHIYRHRSNLPWLIHNFYIDEVQDFTEAELYLLLSCSQCPNGSFLCGDSAQSIMRGVSFRFTDVRSLFHELSQSFQCEVVVPDKPHYLTVNYRAHAGILRVADSVIELLGRFFQDSFDAIPNSIQSQSQIEMSQKPLLLYYEDPDELPHMLAGNQLGANREIEFGAHQAIIVPSKDTKLPKSLESAIVLTVLEAKGLEFNDVLLFNFFSESMVDDKSWELVSAYTSIEIENSKEKITHKYSRVLEKFNESNHKTLNTEFKRLYTALTRAKRNLWICDKGSLNTDTMHPMYNYLLKKQLVKEFKLEESGTGFISEESTRTAEEWKKAGDYLFSKQLWIQARKCYMKAGADSRIFLVDAYLEVQQESYQKAAIYFLSSDKIDHERSLLIKAAMCLRAVKYKAEEKSWYYSKVALFCEKLMKIKWAGQLYLSIKDFDNFIRASESKKRYSRVIRRLLLHKEMLMALKKAVEYGDKANLKGTTIGKLAYTSVRFYMSKNNKEVVRESIKYLDSSVLRIKYLELNGFHEDVIDAHVESHNYKLALEKVIKCGLYEKGIKIARQCKNSKEEIKFLLLDAYAKLHANKSNITAIKALIKKINTLEKQRKGDNSIAIILAQIYLLKAQFFKDIEACQKAMDIFDTLSIMGGFLEAVNILLTLCNSEDHLFCEPKHVLEYSLKAIRLAQVFCKDSRSLSVRESSEINSYMELNQMQKLMNGEIFVPLKQAYWLSSVTNKSCFQINEIQVMFKEHLYNYCENWLKSTKAIFKVLSDFRLHKQVEEKGLIPQNADAYFTDYLNKLSIIVELNKAVKCYPASQKILLSLFSPLSVLHNHAWRQKHLVSLQSLTSIIDAFKSEYEEIIKEQELCCFTSLDQCIQLWKLSLIVYGNTISLHHSIRQVNPPHHYLSGYRQKHIFLAWINSTFLLSCKHQVTKFLSYTYEDLLTPIAQSDVVFQSISDENLLYILILQSIPSIFLISLAWDRRFFIPKILQYLVTNFNFFNQQKYHCYSMVRACVLERQQSYDLFQLGHRAVKHLEKILEFLLQNNCRVISRVFENKNDTMTMYYLILMLTISANLLVAQPTLDNDYVHMNLILLVTKLETLKTTNKPYFIDYIYNNLKKTEYVHNIFIIVQELLGHVRNPEMQQVFPSSQGDDLYAVLMIKSHTYPNFPLRRPLEPNYELFQNLQLQNLQEGEENENEDQGEENENEDQGEENENEDQGEENENEDQGEENENEDQGEENENEDQGEENENEDQGEENENEDQGETPVVYEEEVLIEQQSSSVLLNKLKENMIENHICKLCNVKISVDEKIEQEIPSSSTFEQQDSVKDHFDKHIASRSHQRKKRAHNDYWKVKMKFDFLERDVFVRLEKCKNSLQLSPEDDIKLTHIESQLASIHSIIETHTADDSWIQMTERVKEKIRMLDEIYRQLGEPIKPLEEDEFAEPVVSPSVEIPALIELMNSGSRKRGKKFK